MIGPAHHFFRRGLVIRGVPRSPVPTGAGQGRQRGRHAALPAHSSNLAVKGDSP